MYPFPLSGEIPMKALGYITAVVIAVVIAVVMNDAQRSRNAANEQYNREVFREAQRLNEELKAIDAEPEQRKKTREEHERLRRMAELKFDPLTGELLPANKGGLRAK